jgi:hypothetical protein
LVSGREQFRVCHHSFEDGDCDSILRLENQANGHAAFRLAGIVPAERRGSGKEVSVRFKYAAATPRVNACSLLHIHLLCRMQAVRRQRQNAGLPLRYT